MGVKMSYIINDECIACFTCLDACDSGAIKEGSPIFYIDKEICTDCGSCVDSCPTNAIVEE